jgi:hypothetical protein
MHAVFWLVCLGCLQREAKRFIAKLMGGDEVRSDGSSGDGELAVLAVLAAAVEQLSEAALGIVSSITGAPSPQSFR